jgi:predicted phosphodiesterase
MQPVLYAILSDIHANLQALKAVEADALRVRKALDAASLHFIVLGDVVDYGPQPNQCMDWVERHAEIVIQGNHDLDVANSMYQEPKTIAKKYWPITIWTRWVLTAEHKQAINKGQGCRWQARLYHEQLPTHLQDFVLFHSALTDDKPSDRIDDAYKAWRNIQCLHGATYGLFGHTHIQGYFVDDPLGKRNHNRESTTMYLICPEATKIQEMTSNAHLQNVLLEPDPNSAAVKIGQTPWAELPPHPTLFNPGGLGQPRPSAPTRFSAPPDNRASYMLLKANGQLQFQFRRVPYDFEETIRLLREEVNWPPRFQTLGSDILKESEGVNPFPRDAWHELMRPYRESLRDAPQKLPKLIEETLIPQLM